MATFWTCTRLFACGLATVTFNGVGPAIATLSGDAGNEVTKALTPNVEPTGATPYVDGEATLTFWICSRLIVVGLELVAVIEPVTLIGDDTLEIATSTGVDGKVTAKGVGPAMTTLCGEPAIVTFNGVGPAMPTLTGEPDRTTVGRH